MKTIATLLIILFSVTAQAQTKKPKSIKTTEKINAKVVSYELKTENLYVVYTDKGTFFYSADKPKIGSVVRISVPKKK